MNTQQLEAAKDKVKKCAEEATLVIPYAISFGVIAFCVYAVSKLIRAKKS